MDLPPLSQLMFRVIAALDHPVLLVDSAHIIRLANPAAAALLECGDQILTGQPLAAWMDAPPEPGAAPLPCRWQTALGRELPVPTRATRLDGGMILYQPAPPPGLVQDRAAGVLRLHRLLEQDSGPVAVLAIGLDRFGLIAGMLGHHISELALQAVAQRLRTCLSDEDALFMLGEERFLLLLSGLDDRQEIAITIDQIRVRLQDPMMVQTVPLDITASLGVTLAPDDGQDPTQLIQQAESALMQAKLLGIGQIQRFHQDSQRAAAHQFSVRHGLRRAIDQEEFVPFFQPQVDPVTHQILGMEALVRWASPTGLVAPSEYIPIAEDYGMIEALGEQMLLACGRQMRLWQDRGVPLVPVAVNVSGRQFLEPRRLIATVDQMLEESGLSPSLFELELTESSAMRDPEGAIGVMRELTGRGLRCSIDDFGTGYSSLAVLKRFPLHKLKIDRSFIIDVPDDADGGAIVNALIAMAHALRLKVVCEGVETLAQLAFLQGLRCDSIQGYLFSRPRPASEIEPLLRTGVIAPSVVAEVGLDPRCA